MCAPVRHPPTKRRNQSYLACGESGTTWLQFILYTLCTKGGRELDHISNYVPFLENDKSFEFDQAGASRVAAQFASGHAAIGWRLFNTHLWWDMLPKGPEAKYIYVVRSAKDVVFSFYAHLSHQALSDGGFSGSFEEFFIEWCAGKIPFGPWADSLKSFMVDTNQGLQAAARDERILILSYAELKNDIGSAVRRIISHCNVDISEAEIEKCLPRFDISYMKANNAKFEPRSVRWEDKGDGFQFIRHGQSGDGQRAFSAAQDAAFADMLASSFPDGIPSVMREFCG
ncbi:unnamed protein product [Prorocentrum cordatum]|uniref:Sulfotransferase domain-containing protein n=1 Tax=Prorocentrum cordatum TaxID=2364126 RepID=A0ABN9S418_9DINO|nr:unnamed protein product [Polarella glacialis]